MESIWSQETDIPERPSLEGDMEAEAAVIGAGMAGLLTAYFLKRQGKDVVVLEADRIASGQTKNTTAKITSQHGLFYTNLVRKIGREKAGLYVRANEEAIQAYQQLIQEKDIHCDFLKMPSYLYSRKDADVLKREADLAAELGSGAYFTEITELPFRTVGGVCFPEQAVFHPLKFAEAIAAELTIYEQTRAISVDGHVIKTDRGNVTAEHIVFATHYPFLIVPGFYFMRQHQERSYVLALSGAATYPGMYYSAEPGGVSLRNAGDLLLFGGGAHRTGDSSDCAAVYKVLRREAEEYYPQCQEAARWSAQDCVTHDHIPFIGKYSHYRPDWYVATGFKKWGMTSSMVAARLITDLICGQPNPYEELFSPQRLLVSASAKDFIKDMGISVKGLVRGLFHPSRRCPHMGCELKWNPTERTWDCPCHGSRFGMDGELLDNPAQTEIRL